jgi:hypothetical protein
MSLLPPSIEQHRPNPLGEEVGAANAANPENIGMVADRLAVLKADEADLPRILKDARAQMEESDRLREEAQGKIAAGVSAWREYQNALIAVRELSTDIAAGENLLARCQKDAQGLQADFDLWPVHLRGGKLHLVVARVSDALAARKMIDLLPPSLKALRAKLQKALSEIAAVEKLHGFAPNPPARPASQSPQPEGEQQYDSPAAFRGQQ